MEQLLHYVWKHKIFPLRQLVTTEGQTIEVVHPGLHNQNAGPDFFNAKVKIDGQLWVGNVEIHQRSSDWFRHHHDKDAAYDNVILHVVGKADMEVHAPLGGVRTIPQLELPIPEYVQDRYDELVRSDETPRCRTIVANQPTLMVHNWLAALQVERLEQKMQQIMQRHELCEKSWENTFFVTLARNFGYGVNGDAFEAWARSIPLRAVAKHRDNLFQIEAIFFGQAGLLETTKKNEFTEYFEQLQREYRYLRQKFSLVPIDSKLFRFARLRPSNSPHVRIAQLAMLYYQQKISFSKVINSESIEDFHALLTSGVSEFWTTHYSFSSQPSAVTEKKLSEASRDLLLINTFIPILFAYGHYKNEETFRERAIRLLENLKPEDNHIIRAWATAGIVCESAADSQGLIQLTRQYCEPHNCLRCRFGYEFIRQNPAFLQEQTSQSDH